MECCNTCHGCGVEPGSWTEPCRVCPSCGGSGNGTVANDNHSAYKHEPPPKPGRVDVADYVLADIQERVEMGRQKYGTKLQTGNGRDPLWDLYQELLDALFYCRQAILEREGK